MTVDQLWAPWRLEYIKGETKTHLCPFCESPKGDPSEENLVLYRDDEVFVIMNKFPYNPGHLLVIPRAHVGKPEELPPGVWLKLAQAVEATTSVLKLESKPPAFNLGMNLGPAAGAGIPDHMHWHVLPRWPGDTNFMPLLAETKAIPAHNVTVYRRLAPLFEGFSDRLKQR